MSGLGDWLASSLFSILAGITILSALATISLRSPVYAAIWFGMTLLGTAGLFLFQGAQFLAVATIVVYAGAILVTFLFVLMLAQPQGRSPYDRMSWEALVSATTGSVIIGILTMTITSVLDAPTPLVAPGAITAADRQTKVLAEEHVAQLGNTLFGPYLLSVEVGGTLLLAALIGAAVIVARGNLPAAEPLSPVASSKGAKGGTHG
jgi:NADH-quinone oxidoreductase subunit J